MIIASAVLMGSISKMLSVSLKCKLIPIVCKRVW